MLEWEFDATGIAVPKKDGKLLASRHNPIKEAKSWVHAQASLLNGFSCVVVFGVGGGFHIRELAAQNPKLEIIVVEQDYGLASEIEIRNGKFPENVLVLSGDEPQDFLKNPEFKKALKKIFRILKYAPSVRTNPNYFQRIQTLLTGRTQEAFQIHLKERPRLNALLSDLEVDGLISIYDVTEHLTDTENQESALWLALRELVL